MFGKKIPLFSLMGFKVGIDLTWLILAVLITWSLAKGLFPNYFDGYSNATYWWMSVAGALGLFVSIVFHEFCHSLVARRFGMPIKGITLFLFGGVAEMNEEPQSPKAEFLMALMGPVSSAALGGLLALIVFAGRRVDWSGPITGVLTYLVWLNLILAGFNLLPAFPLDGGRVLRSILWKIKGNLRWATRIASGLGSGIGLFFIIIGIMTFIMGGFIGGMWYFLIGMFIRWASQMSYKQLMMRKALGGEPIGRFMKTDPVTIPSSTSVKQLVNDYFYRFHYKMFPVADNGDLIGCVDTKQVKELPKDEWADHTVSEVTQPCSVTNTITPETDAMKVLSQMNKTGNSRLLVTEQNKLVGIVTLKDMLKFLSMKIDLEQE
ncbi:MAG: site-2 protease family protein [Sedimentisphaerales bacterium]|nr:site-2 protease family protein [Sedimentisphaerales bacterium]